MKSKKINKLIGTLVLTSVFSGVVVPSINIITAYAYTPTYDYSKVMDLMPNNSEEWYKENCIKVTPESHPNLFMTSFIDNTSKVLAYYNLPLDNTIYYWEETSFMGDKTYWYVKAIKYEAVEGTNDEYTVTYQTANTDSYGNPFTVYEELRTRLGADKALHDHLIALKEVEQTTSGSEEQTTSETPSGSEEQTPILEKVNIRLGGANRFETSIKIADSFRGDGKLNGVILGSSSNFPDALAGGVLTKKYNAPILLSNKTDVLSKVTLDYIKANVNKNGQIIILGSVGVMDDSIVNNLKAAGFTKIKRLGGSDRYATNLAIINDFSPSVGSDVIISYSHNFPDSLSVSPVSAATGSPILLVKGKLSAEQKAMLAKIKPSNIYITGGTGVIPSSIETELKQYSSKVERLGGATRYETSKIINDKFKNVLTGSNALLASGLNFPDALSGTALAVKLNAPIVLVNPNDTSLQKDFISKNNKTNTYVLGGTGSVSTKNLTDITQ